MLGACAVRLFYLFVMAVLLIRLVHGRVCFCMNIGSESC